MELPAERPEALFEVGLVDAELSRQAKEAEIVAVPTEREDVRALRTEVDVYRRAAAAILANLKRRCRRLGGHFNCYAPKELPHPHVVLAFGLLKTNPLLIRFVS
jgi:hypothetical protein